ncbi:lipid II:glycine glycyltransferase FemX [Natronoflexus pectinivorans]|uniref:FemAB family protein n=1 Tax=Natronoflexus pectinivorans TaxID=682526 RepID=A0A4R2GHT5_9BACT|nr:peptidoglycan bridge formation glycyltransferase FemA/FemB family protein [Natronoflexus pectinivorans]TCO06839.1 FemAB family protein [Natronoflexus pectinivorans]
MSQNNSLTFEICTNQTNPEWDQFISGISSVCHEQSSVWADTMTLSGWSSARVIVKENDKIVCGAQILTIEIPFFGQFGYIQQGPCIKSAENDAVKLLIDQIKEFTKKNKLQFTTVDMAYNLKELPQITEDKDFSPHPDRLPPEAPITSTLILDLTQELDTIMAGFKSGRRKSIRSGLKHGLEIRTGTRNDIELLFDLIDQTCKRRDTKPLYPDISFLYKLWDTFAPNKWVVMHIAETDGQPVCASLSFTFGDTFRNSIWGWSGDYVHLNASDVIDWKTICWAKENGFKYYDFVHLDTISAKAILAGNNHVTEEIKERPHYGSTFYKMRFGGDVIFYPGVYSFFPSKFKKLLFTVSAKYLLNNSLIKKIIRIIRNKASHKN